MSTRHLDGGGRKAIFHGSQKVYGVFRKCLKRRLCILWGTLILFASPNNCLINADAQNVWLFYLPLKGGEVEPDIPPYSASRIRNLVNVDAPLNLLLCVLRKMPLNRFPTFQYLSTSNQ
jgi:hypothetical protein